MNYKTIVLSIFPLMAACGNPLTAYQQTLNKAGYIIYETPLADASTGTLIGGSPRSMSLVAPPQTCFPDPAKGKPALRVIEDSAIGNISQAVSFSVDVTAGLLNFLGNSNSVFNVGAGFNVVQTIEMTTSGAKVESFDQIVLEDWYQNGMPTACKDHLDQVGFIIQALRVDQMTFAFKNSNGGYIHLDANAIKSILNISADVKYSVSQDYLLTFDTPKYIGYQLGKLQRSDNGNALYRASSILPVLDKYVFKPINLFGNSSNAIISNRNQERQPAAEPTANDFAPITHANEIAPYSVIR